ncbi:MAG: T9SS type A sorting domain-containing protein [Bacteroidia bacterium]|nr:T9SS type A sorting domain-containing protein [Bacteroidia bacterium]
MRNTLIVLALLASRLLSLAYVTDSIKVYSRREFDRSGYPFPYRYSHEKQVAYLFDSDNRIFKIKHYTSGSDSNNINPPKKFYDLNFPQNISFKIDTNKVFMYYDSLPGNNYLLFDFNVAKGDTEKIIAWQPNSGVQARYYQKIVIDSIVSRSFNFVGYKQVYYFHPSIGSRRGEDFWIKGLANGHGGFLNLSVETGYIKEDVPGIPEMIFGFDRTTCVDQNGNVIPILDTANCGMYVMGADAPSHTKINFSVSPNPASELLTITGELQATGNVRIDISNMLGQTITLPNEKMPDKTFNKTVSIKNLPAGLYLLSLTQGETIYTQRIVKVGQ